MTNHCPRSSYILAKFQNIRPSKEDGLCWEEVELRGNAMYDQGLYPNFFLVWYLSFAIGHAILHTFIDIFAKPINLGVFKNQRKKTNSKRPSEMVRLY